MHPKIAKNLHINSKQACVQMQSIPLKNIQIYLHL